MKAEHNSRNLIYRNPFGAVTSGSKVYIRLALAELGIPKHVRLAYEFDGATAYADMPYVYDIAGACIYEAVIDIPETCGLMYYYFDIASHSEQFYYSVKEGETGGCGKIYNEIPQNKYQITVYDDNFETPKWWRNSVCYQIFPDRFAIGKDGGLFAKRSDIIKRDWGDEPFYKAEQFGGKYLANDFFGGNLAGIEEKLPYLSELGITSVYLNPIFKAYSNHKYDTGDYKTIDPMFGTEKDFENLCKNAKKYGIRIILDGVFNHTGSDSLYFNKNGNYDSLGAYQSQNSPYYDWFRFFDFPNKYESWWGIDTLPQTEEKSESFQKYILTDENSVVKKWLKKGASGWRLDVVDELPDFFVKLLRREVKNENPEAVIIGEVWEDASNKVAYGEKRQYFMGGELDSVMNYPLRNAMAEFALGSIDAEEFDRRIMTLKENYPKPAFYALLNFLSTHDIPRILTVLGGKNPESKEEMSALRLNEFEKANAVKLLKCLIVMQVLLPGVPTIFYGDEAGMEGYADPFCRRCYPWGAQDGEIMDFYKKIIKLRNDNEVFKSGEFETVYKVENCYAFVRYSEDDIYLMIINMGNQKTVRLDAARFGVHSMEDVLQNFTYQSEDGIYFEDIPEKSAKVLKCK